jgi:hypothetical protein
MIYTYNASGNYSGNYASLGIKKFMVQSRLGNVLKAGTPITIKSADQSITMSGIIIYYDNESTGKDAFVSVDIEKSNGDLSYYSQNWTLIVNDSLADPEVAAIIESSYGKPIESAYVDGITGRPRTPQLDSDDQPAKYVPRYIEEPIETPIEIPFENPYIKPNDVQIENPYVNPEEIPYVQIETPIFIPTESPVFTPPESTYTAPESTYTPPVSTYTPPVSTYTPPVSTYTPPVSTYTPPVSTYTPPVSTYTPPMPISDEPFYIVYLTPILVLLFALIVGVILFFVYKNKNSPQVVKNVIAAFGKIW